jgi:hypothetical protein
MDEITTSIEELDDKQREEAINLFKKFQDVKIDQVKGLVDLLIGL